MVKRDLIRSATAAVIGALLCAVASTATAAALHAELEHSRVREGEPVRLLLRSEGDGAGEIPDLTPLEEDFEVLGTQQSRRLQIVNGRAESSLDWIVTLLPRRAGAISVPAMRAGDAVTEPIELTVAAAAVPEERADAPGVFVEAEVDEASPYVQGEVRYTVRVFDGVGMLEGSLTEPKGDDLRVTPLGETRSYETTVNGRPYRVHERQYAVAPLRSGDVTIPGVTLEARVRAPQGRRVDPFGGSLFEEMFGEDPFAGFPGGGFDASFFDEFLGRGQNVRLRSNPVALEVRARPGSASEEWFLPARKVELVESFAPESPTFRVGEVVRRTVTLRALGASSEQLPRFAMPEVEGVRIYDEGSRDGSAPSDDGTVAILERTVGILPTRAGAVTLPAIEVKWFDVEAGETRTASVPARTIEVSPAAGQPAAEPAAAAAHARTTASAPAARAVEGAAAAPVVEAVRPTDEADRTWFWALVVCAALGAGAAAGFLLVRRGRPAGVATGEAATSGEPSSRRLARALRRACDAGDAPAAREALVRWARASLPGLAPVTPAAIADRLRSARLGAAARDLDRAIYAPDGGSWRGAELWQAFREASRTDDVQESATPELRSLYPELGRAS
jgi:hypothetical protein